MADKPELKSLIEQFIERLTHDGKSYLTIIAYQNDLSQLASFLANSGKNDLSLINHADLEAFKNDMANNKYTPKSVARKLNAVKSFFRWAKESGLVKEDPAASVAHPKYELGTPRILSPLEYRALRDAARDEPRIAAIVELLLQTGMRISEVASLKTDDIKNNTVTIGKRIVPLSPAAVASVPKYLDTRPKIKSEHLFITKTGRPLLVRNIRAAIERCFAEAGIENATVNDLRNTFIVYQLSRGVDLLTVSQIVGHKRLATTERYLALVKERATSKRAGISEL